MKSGIYLIENVDTGKVYVGSAINIADRWKRHIRLLNRNCHHSIKLQNAWNKYGPDNFSHSILELVGRDSLVEREQYWLDKYDASGANGYNVLSRSYSSLGLVHGPETLKKIGAAHKGKTISAENKAAVSAALKGRKISEAEKINRAKSWTPERRKRRSEISLSIVLSPEARAKISIFHKGKLISDETRAKISMARIGKKASAEARINMSEGAKNRPAISEETRLKMSEARALFWQKKRGNDIN